MTTPRRILIFFAIGFFVAVAMAIPTTTRAACGDWCANDAWCPEGYCENFLCKCDDTPPCSDTCEDRGLCSDGTDTVHITDCYGINGGLGYCFNCGGPVCDPSQGNACSAYNSCGMSNSGSIQCDGSCSASPPAESLCGVQPVGAFEVAACSNATGWSFDKDYTGSVNVRIYRDGPAGTGTLMGTVAANGSRPDIQAWALGAGYAPPDRTNSGWNWAIPLSLKDGISHTLYAYAINVNSSGVATGTNPLLSGSPKTLVCTDPPTGTLTGSTCTTATGNATDSGGAPVNVRIYNGLAGAGGVLIGTGSANPNFSAGITPPLDGAPHTLYAYGQDIPSGTWYQLSGSASVTCWPAVPPVVTITQIDRPNYCQTGPEGIVTWNYTSSVGLAQKEWQIQVAGNPGFSPVVYDSGIKSGTTTTASTGQGVLGFGQTYWVRVKAWDIGGNMSAWSGSGSFTTPPGAYPLAAFTVSPSSPIAKQDTTFTDTSNYGTGTPTTREWIFGDGTGENPGSSPTIHQYVDTASGITVTLRVSSTNSGADFCTATKNFNVAKPIPIYKEVLPR